MEYEDKVFEYLEKNLKPGTRISISDLTNESEKLINAIKGLIDAEFLKDVFFTNDYRFVYRDIPIEEQLQDCSKRRIIFKRNSK